MASWSLFPFWLHCNVVSGTSDSGFRDAFVANKPKGLSWYAYDVFVESAESVEFIAYGMYDNVDGGVGDEIARFTVAMKVPQVYMNWRARKRAEEVRAEELRQIEEDAIMAHMNAILANP